MNVSGWRRILSTGGIAALVLAIGGGVFAVLMATAPTPETNEGLAPPRIVRVFEARPGTHRIAITSYGVARAADELDLKAEVEGTLEFLHEQFEEGQVLQPGEIARIEAKDYQNAYDLADADVQERQLHIALLEQRAENSRALMKLRKEQTQLTERELERSRQLLTRGDITSAAFEETERIHVEGLTALKTLENELALHPRELEVERARLAAAKLRRDKARDDLDDCSIKLPYPALCLSQGADLHEEISRGQSLGTFMRLEKAEVLAMVEPRKALMLFPEAKKFTEPIDLTNPLVNDIIRDRFDEFLVPAHVTWRVGEGQAQWEGRATRVSPVVDERTRTAPAVIEIDNPYRSIQPGVRPAIIPGMFLEVTLFGQTLSNVFVLPRDAVHENEVYVERDGKLVVKRVTIAASEDDRVVVTSGLENGDNVILTDLFPVANGMRVTAQTVENPVSHRPTIPELHSELTPE